MQNSDHIELRILIFDIGGVKMGIDMDTVSEIRRMDQLGGRNAEIFRFDEKFSFRQPVVYKTPMAMFIKNDMQISAILIEQPEEVGLPVSIDDIRPLPALIGPCSLFWAAVVKNGEIILIADPYRLI